MITERQKQILDCLIREHIKTAEPVASDFLSRKYDFGLCPSAIRLELQSLLKQGYLEQPHTSAGRVPTDKAYRLFVNNILEKENKEREKLKRLYENEFKIAADLTKHLAEASSVFSMMHFLNKELYWQAGWEELSKEPEFNNQEFLSEFVNFIDDFDKNIKNLKMNTTINIFIGKEIPAPKTHNLSLICSKININNYDSLIFLIGPKRMNYDKNIRLMNSLNNFLENLYE